jgi:hypothetical protein
MPLLTAEKHQWTKQPPYNFYHFPEEHRAGWQTFWEEMDGDLDKILEFAKKASIECPNEWFESLHRFLFLTFAGNAKLLKSGADTSFGTFLGKIRDNHSNNPKNKQWYTVRGITQNNFIAMLERASEIKDVRQVVAFINARVKDLGFYLYSEFLLSKTKGKSEIKSVASDFNKKAYKLEKKALGRSPLDALVAGNEISHSLFPEDTFEVTEVVRDASNEITMLVTRDSQNRVAFIADLWNVAQMEQALQPIGQPDTAVDPDISGLLQVEDYNEFINALEQQTQQNPNLIHQRETLIQQWQQRHPGTHTVTI